ncbi:MAG: hypothetical protein ACYDCQ_17050 [Dehalococcoidia bacterium]
METFYCAGCRFQYPAEKAARITAGAHRDGQPVGFCFVCAREYFPDSFEHESMTLDAQPQEQPASA